MLRVLTYSEAMDMFYAECYDDEYFDEYHDEMSEIVHGFYATFDVEGLSDKDIDEAFAEYLKSKLTR